MSDTQAEAEERMLAEQERQRAKSRANADLRIRSRKGMKYLLCFAAVGASAFGALHYMAHTNSGTSSQVAAPPKMKGNAGGTNNSVRIRQDYWNADQADAKAAERAHQSYTPALPGRGLGADAQDRGLSDASKGSATPDPATTKPPAPGTQPSGTTAGTSAPLGKGGRGDVPSNHGTGGADLALKSDVGSGRSVAPPGLSPAALEQIYEAWSSHGIAIEMGKAPARESVKAGSPGGDQANGPPVTGGPTDLGMRSATALTERAANTRDPAGQGKTLLAAGRGIYAHTITAANSDQKGPVLADVDSGPFTGARLIGEFDREDDRLVVHFTQLIIDDHDPLSVDARAIAPDTMETAVASEVNEHYLTRIALPTAAAFVQGLGQAMQSTNTQSYTGGLGGITSFTHLTLPQQLGVAAGSAGQTLGQVLQKATPQQATVTLAANSSIGVLFLKPVISK
ncbi:DotG/IcmE/VirB10 family protein [Asaia bogorensis]|nr:TrbI/VirB10 family protein [Asaia bogorensis]